LNLFFLDLEVLAMMSEIDEDGDGRLSFPEIVKLLNKK
jgi:Ca2+-binding EF-hand superfamily protein